MYTLPLADLLWKKLDAANRDLDIPDVLRSLSTHWDEDQAISLFWEYLHHQGCCFGATCAYALGSDSASDLTAGTDLLRLASQDGLPNRADGFVQECK